MTPNMQGVIMAIGKSRSVYDKCGPEAAFFKVHDLLHATPPVHLISSLTTPPPPEHLIIFVSSLFIPQAMEKPSVLICK